MSHDDIRAALAAATPGPWRTHDFGHPGEQEPSSIVVHTGKFDWNDVQDPDGTSAIAWMPAWGRQDSDNAHLIANAPTWLADLLAEVDRLTRWKAEALPVMTGLQELGKALGLTLGESITGPSAVDAANALRARAEAAERKLAEVREITEHYSGRTYTTGCPDSILRALDGGDL